MSRWLDEVRRVAEEEVPRAQNDAPATSAEAAKEHPQRSKGTEELQSKVPSPAQKRLRESPKPMDDARLGFKQPVFGFAERQTLAEWGLLTDIKGSVFRES